MDPEREAVQTLLRRSLCHINTLNGLERASVQARSSRRARQSNESGPSVTSSSSSSNSKASSSGSAACSACKDSKTKCIRGLDDHKACARCRASGKECIYPLPRKRGPAGGTRITKLLDTVERDLRSLLHKAEDGGDPFALHQTCANGVGSNDKGSLVESDSDQTSQTGIELAADGGVEVDADSGNPALLRKPLEFLASLQADTVEVQDFLPEIRRTPETHSLYALKHEADLSKDPVFQGIITEDELNSLLAFYFSHLRPYFWHFSPEVHTQAFLRLCSPFLTSAIAACVALFYPLPGDKSIRLTEYAHALATSSFAEGNRSLEVMQAYLCLLHWAPAPTPQSADRSWQYQGQAMRIASEIRLDSIEDSQFCASYRYLDCFDASVHTGLLECRKRSLVLLYCSDIALATQSGRIESLNGPLILKGLKWAWPQEPPCSADYDYMSNIEMNYVFVKAIHLFNGLKSEEDSQDTSDGDLRDSFVASWQGQLADCLQKWSNRGYFMTVFGLNINVMLLLLSLQFRSARSSAHTTLEECCSLALQTLRTVDTWHFNQGKAGAESLAHASNFVLVNLAYGAGLLLKLASIFEAIRVEEVAELCSRVANVLREIGRCRNTGMSIATQYAGQIESLLFRTPHANRHEFQAFPTTAATPSAHLTDSAELFDFSALSNHTFDTLKDLGTYSFGDFLHTDFDQDSQFVYNNNSYAAYNNGL